MIAALVLSSLLSSLVTISDLALQGMRKEEQDNDVRLAATQALYNAIEFASTNFRNETERNYLMQVLFQSVKGRASGAPACCAVVRTHVGVPFRSKLRWYQYSWIEECKLVLVSPVSLLLDNALRQRWLIRTLMWVICACFGAFQHYKAGQHKSGRLRYWTCILGRHSGTAACMHLLSAG